jgi:hypothetical protein
LVEQHEQLTARSPSTGFISKSRKLGGFVLLLDYQEF